MCFIFDSFFLFVTVLFWFGLLWFVFVPYFVMREKEKVHMWVGKEDVEVGKIWDDPEEENRHQNIVYEKIYFQ